MGIAARFISLLQKVILSAYIAHKNKTVEGHNEINSGVLININ